MLVQHQGKLTIAMVEELTTETMLNYVFKSGNQDVINKYTQFTEMRGPEFNYWSPHSGEAVDTLPKQNIVMRGYESNPGCWYYTSDVTGIGILIFSDGKRKNCFKGTSYEIVLPNRALLSTEVVLLIDEINKLIHAPIDFLAV